jgi:multiple sugar transport system substrate-binding protein
MIKKRALLVAAAGAALLVTGCAPGAGPSTDDSTTITVWHYWDGANADAFDDAVSRYEADHPDVQISVVNVPGGELLTKLQTAATNDQLPTIAITDLVWVPQLAQTGKLVDLAPALREAGLDQDIYPSMLSFGAVGKQQLSVPVSSNTLAYMYNKQIFRDAGLDPEKPPTTWEELTAAADVIKERTGLPGYEIFTQPGDNGEGVTWNFQVNLWQAGGEFLNADNTKAAFNSPAGKRALQFWVDLVTRHGAPLGPWGAFEKGQAASAQEGSWMVGIWATDAPIEFGTAPLPIPEGGTQATNMGGEQAMVFSTASAAQQQAAIDFLMWFDSPENVTTWSQATGMLPVVKSVAESNAYRTWVSANAPALQPFIDLLPSAHARPNTPVYARVSFAFAKQVEQALNGQKTVDQALADAEAEVNQILAEA